jgi:hypothetical protein
MVEQLADLRFRFHVSVFGDAHVDTDPRSVDFGWFYTCICKSFMSTIDTYAACSRTYAKLFAGLMPGSFEFTDACRQIAHVANGKARNPTTTRQEVFAQGVQIVSQRGSEPHASDNNTFVEIIHYWSKMLSSN